MTNPTPLSPAAQAVMIAATNGNENVINDPVYKQCIAAALRAGADQVVPEVSSDDYDRCLVIMAEIRAKLLAIATELKGANTKESPH